MRPRGYRRSLEAPRMPLDAPKRPKRPLEAPKRLEEAPRCAQDAPRCAQEAQVRKSRRAHPFIFMSRPRPWGQGNWGSKGSNKLFFEVPRVDALTNDTRKCTRKRMSHARFTSTKQAHKQASKQASERASKQAHIIHQGCKSPNQRVVTEFAQERGVSHRPSGNPTRGPRGPG